MLDATHGQVCEFIQTELLSLVEWPELRSYVEYWIYDRKHVYRDMFPCAATQAAGGNGEAAIPLAAYWSVMVLAARIQDDFQDDEGHDKPWFDQRKMPVVSTALIGLGQAALGHLSHDVASDIVFNLGSTLALVANAQANPPLASSSLEYLRYVGRLTGSVWASVAWAGARIGTDDVSIQNIVQNVGFHCGMADALADDCNDLSVDLYRRKHTMAVLHAVELTEHYLNSEFCEELQNCSSEESINRVLEMLTQMGSLQYVLDQIDQHKQVARQLLTQLPNSCCKNLEKYVLVNPSVK